MTGVWDEGLYIDNLNEMHQLIKWQLYEQQRKKAGHSREGHEGRLSHEPVSGTKHVKSD